MTTLYSPLGDKVEVTSPTRVAQLLARGYSESPILPPSPDAGKKRLLQLPSYGAVNFRWDDGFASHFTIARMATARGQRHTFGVTTNLIGQASYLTAAQIKAIHGSGHEIASHSKDHVRAVGSGAPATPALRRAQYDDSKTALEAIVGAGQVTTWIYPYGGTARDVTTDSELWLTYDRIMDVASPTTRRWQFPAGQPGGFMVASLNLDGTAKMHALAKAAIRQSAVQPITTSFYSHDLDSVGSVTTAQITELMDLCQTLQVPCVTAAEAWAGGSPIRDGGFEAADLSNWEVIPTTTQTATIATDVPVTGLPGTKSLKLTNAVAAETVYVEQSVPVVGGKSYVLSGRLRLSVAGDASNHIRYRISQRDRTGAATPSVSINNGVVVSANAWTAPAPLVVAMDPATAFAKVSVLLTGVIGDGYADHLHFGPTVEGNFG